MGFDRSLIFGKQVDMMYGTIVESYRMLKVMSYAFGYNGDEEFNQAFVKYFGLKDRDGNPIDMERFMAEDSRFAKEMLIPFLKMYPRRAKIGTFEMKKIYEYYWDKMVTKEFELKKEDLRNLKSYFEIKKTIKYITKKLNEKGRTFSLRSYDNFFPKNVVKRICEVNKSGSDIVKELADKGKLYISEDSYVYTSMKKR